MEEWRGAAVVDPSHHMCLLMLTAFLLHHQCADSPASRLLQAQYPSVHAHGRRQVQRVR
jgi:hypothetical protein